MLASTHNQRTPSQRSAWSRRAALLMCMALIVVSGQGSQGQGSPPGLSYFKNFFVTGNFVVASLDFGSQEPWRWTGHRDDPRRRQHAERRCCQHRSSGCRYRWCVLVALAIHHRFGGEPHGSSDVPGLRPVRHSKEVIAPSPDPTFSPCWSGGGQGTNVIKTFRADVRRFLPVPQDENGVPQGKMLVNDNDLMTAGLPVARCRSSGQRSWKSDAPDRWREPRHHLSIGD